MCLPHSSASTKRFFSRLNLIKTDIKNWLIVAKCQFSITGKTIIRRKYLLHLATFQIFVKMKAKVHLIAIPFRKCV